MDRYLELVNPMWAAHEVRARVVRVERETLDVTTLTLQPTNTWHGFRGRPARPGRRRDRRRPAHPLLLDQLLRPGRKLHGDRTFTITVRGHDAEGLVSKHLAAHAERRHGRCTSPRPRATSCCPPLLPRQAADDLRRLRHHPGDVDAALAVDFRYEGRITFVHYARTPEETIFAAELDELAAAARTSTSRVHTRTGDKRLNELQLRRLVPSYADTPDLRVRPGRRWSRRSRRLYGDRDTPARGVLQDLHASPRPRDATGTVAFSRSGAAAANTGAPLLEQAEALGLRPAYGCRMGICFTCTSSKTEGTVRNVVTGAESSLPDEDIQICVSQPVGDCVVEL